jgi:hypothetical protein
MKIFKGTITLSVSEENAGLIPMLVQFNSSRQGSVEDARLTLEECTKKYIKDEMIMKYLSNYFGIAGAGQVEAIKQLLDSGALQVEFTIEE